MLGVAVGQVMVWVLECPVRSVKVASEWFTLYNWNKWDIDRSYCVDIINSGYVNIYLIVNKVFLIVLVG